MPIPSLRNTHNEIMKYFVINMAEKSIGNVRVS